MFLNQGTYTGQAKSNIQAIDTHAMTISLPTGKWSIYGNKEQGELKIISVEGDGKWTGTGFRRQN